MSDWYTGNERDFFFDGMEVGLLPESPNPSGGPMRYMPYLGSGHNKMWQWIDGGSPAECYADFDGKRFTFKVTGSLGYGVLSIAEVHVSDVPSCSA